MIVTNPSCFGYTDGSAQITASGGIQPYTVDWFGSDPLQLSSGTYNYEVTDNNGCIFSSSVTLYDPLNTSVQLMNTIVAVSEQMTDQQV